MIKDESPRPRSYRGLLALVIILGVLIVLGVIGLVVGAVLKSRGSAAEPAAYAARVAAPGQRLESAQMDGNRILVRLSGGAAGDELVIVDALTGRVVGRIAIDSGAGAKP